MAKHPTSVITNHGHSARTTSGHRIQMPATVVAVST